MNDVRASVTWRRIALWILPALLLAAACRDGSTAPEEHGEPAELELVDLETGALLATFHEELWDGELPTLTVGGGLEVEGVFYDGAGGEIPLEDGFSFNATIATGSQTNVVELGSHGDHMDIEAVGAGTTMIIFQLFHGGHSDWDTLPISLTVAAGG